MEMPKELQRFVIKEKFLDKRAVNMEINLLTTNRKIRGLKAKVKEHIDVEFMHEEPDLSIMDNSIAVEWIVSLKNSSARIAVIWDFSGDKIENTIMSMDEDGEPGTLVEL